jgi:4'-phosphopantetheinyl transferase
MPAPGGPGEASKAAAPLVVAAPSDVVLDRFPGGAELATGTERRRMASLRRAEDRRDFLAARLLARVCAARVAGAPLGRLTLVQRCPRCGAGDHGQPNVRELPELRLSLAHTTGYVAAAAGWNPVGVDVEQVNRVEVDSALATLALTPTERLRVDATPRRDRAFLRLWVRKEALVKLGRLSLDALTEADLSALPVGEAPAVTHRWHDLYVLDWSDATHDVLGAAVSADPPGLLNGLDVPTQVPAGR